MLTLPEIEEGQGPVLMLNLVKFKDKRLYLEEYVPAFNRVMKILGIEGARLVLFSTVIANIVAAEGEAWDAIVLIEYPSAAAFKTMALSNAYREIAEPLRVAALDNLKLFMTRQNAF